MRSANPARNSVPIQFNALHTSFRPSRNPIDPTRLRRHYRRSNAAAHRNEQLRLLPIQSPPPQFARRGSWANSPGPHSQPSSLHVSALDKKSIPSFVVINCLSMQMQSRTPLSIELCQVSASHPIPSLTSLTSLSSHPNSLEATRWSQASCIRITLATLWPQDLASLHLPMPSEQSTEGISLVQRSSVDAINTCTHPGEPGHMVWAVMRCPM